MSAKIIVSYDGTANEDDAIALGRMFAGAGAEVSLAYVRHTPRGRQPAARRSPRTRPRSCSSAAPSCSATPTPARHVVTDRSTPEGLRALAEREGADVIVFCSDSHTAKGHVAIGNSAERLLEGGRTAIAIAPVGPRRAARARRSRRIVAVGDGDGGARDDRRGARRARSARRVAPVANERHRPARDRLAPRGRAGPRLDQLLGRAPDRDRHLPGARAAARRARCRSARDARRRPPPSDARSRAGARPSAQRGAAAARAARAR